MRTIGQLTRPGHVAVYVYRPILHYARGDLIGLNDGDVFASVGCPLSKCLGRKGGLNFGPDLRWRQASYDEGPKQGERNTSIQLDCNALVQVRHSRDRYLKYISNVETIFGLRWNP